MHPAPLDSGERTLRKAGWRLIPLLAIGYAIAYMDRVNLGFAALQMNRDLGFSPQVYGFGAGIFFLSYAVCELPSNLLLLRFGARRWLARIMLTWGLIAGTMALISGPRSFFALRFALGMAEAGFFPGVMYYLCLWFPPAVRARAISRFYVAFPLSSVVMGAVAGSLMGLNGLWGLAGWQWLFIVEALPAVILSGVVFYYLPDGPEDAAWLDDSERTWLKAQLAPVANDPVPTHGADWPAALRDSRTYGMGLFLFLTLGTSYAFSFCAPEIIARATGLSVGKVGWIVAGYSLAGAAAMILNGSHSDRTGERRWHVVLPCLMMTLGLAIGGVSRQPWIVVGAIAWTSVWFYSLQGPALAAPSRFLHGKSMAAGFALINMFSIVSGFAAPYLMGLLKSRLGDYQSGLIWLTLPSLFGGAVMFWLLKPAPAAGPVAAA